MLSRPKWLLVTGLLGLTPNSSVGVCDTQMHERAAFRAIFSFGGSLADLDRGQVGNVPATIANARAFAAEILFILEPAGAREAA
jgi:chromosome partitioning protein